MENLKKLRKYKGYTQQNIADHLNIAKSTYSRYENGSIKLDPETIIKLSIFFDVASDFLLGIIDQPLSNKNLSFLRTLKSENDVGKIQEQFNVTIGGKEISEDELKILAEAIINMTK